MSEVLMNQDKKVCIVVPVYNAEKYLGYCLNSILSQTYTNWKAILVDDGSKDASAEICRRYAELDSRFCFISKPNGGVSSARNAGLALAEGDYLEFLDSDDCLSQDALEKQVSLAARYNAPLVITNMTMLDYNDPKASNRITLNSHWLRKSPCYLTAEEFRAKRMRLIWFTALLEGPCAKLFDLSLWKKLDLHFPEDISLGEDFLTNMRFYEACSGAVFLNESCYYYNCYMGSGSLTEKYRGDLFEIKMYLNEQMEKHLGGRQGLSANEQDAFYCYVASSGLVSLEKEILISGKEQDALVSRIAEMLDHALFYESICYAGYIPERFQPGLEYLKAKNYDMVIRTLRGELPKSEGTQEETAIVTMSSKANRHTGILIRAICKVLRGMASCTKNDSLKNKLLAWEFDLKNRGFKTAFLLRYNNRRRVNGKDILLLNEKLEQLRADSLLLQAENSRLEQLVCELESNVYSRLDALPQLIHDDLETTVCGRLDTLDSKLELPLDTKVQQIIQELEAHSDKTARNLQSEINGYTWTTEQRMHKYAYQRDINDLRQKKKAILLATAEHANIGDAAITLAQQLFLQKYFPDYYQVEVSTYEFNQKEAWLHAILNNADIIFINGGGNMGDVYPAEEAFHRKAVEVFPENKIVIFPQTIHFTHTEAGVQELEKSAAVYNRHKDLTLYVRGVESLQFAQKHFTNVKTMLMPDIVHTLNTNYGFDRKGALLCLREDTEGVLTDAQRQKIVLDVLSQTGSIERTNNIHAADITRDIRGKVVREELMRFASHQVVVTDRLHGMIFSAITGTPCVVLGSFNHKIRDYYHTFFADCRGILFVDNQPEAVPDAVKQALAITDTYYPILEQNPFAAICNGISGN